MGHAAAAPNVGVNVMGPNDDVTNRGYRRRRHDVIVVVIITPRS